MKITLYRTKEDQYGTHGHIENIYGDVLCYTIERPWKDNQTGVSCIPLGLYQCIPHDTEAHPDCWEVLRVPNREAILIHTGNTVKDTEGCIIVGLDFNEFGVGRSVMALDKLRGILPDNFDLDVKSTIG